MSEKKNTFVHFGNYVCECGREFNSSQSYNAHLSHCRLYLGEEKYQARLKQQRMSWARGNEIQSAIKLKKREEDYKRNKLEWESTKHYCEHCGKELPHKYEDIYATGRFCNQSCANARNHSEETLIKIALNSNIKGKNKRSLNGYYKGYYCASSYELIFLVYCLDHNIQIERNKFTFPYEYNNKQHIYLPDWYLPETDTIIECKGSGPLVDEKEVILKKNSVLGHNYKIYYEDDLLSYWEYCKLTYKVKSYKGLCSKLYNKKLNKPKKKNWNVGKNNPSFGKHWYTNDVINIFTYECPDGFHRGRV